jgi:hypothetical protein
MREGTHTGKLSCLRPAISTVLPKSTGAHKRAYLARCPFSMPAMLRSSSISGQ